ncbi:hypothetical protein [Priestia megaterium]|uniref:hypothetical protein n=1 Tax=Priestia megaterium TaxID=1404 RepID=UPI0023D98575|nr:hypothetical protein [Priestia megaterium]MDF2052835.1 hypothetical protein [Priestia megaterium]MDF2060801.1 hypothetical protein [Priestia megaterium]MDH2363633.1 hypothetical protein [Priestia megaterium]MDP1442297.1 hypothetical protein [Priestia megaterium]MDP1471315.1 hypothetical protein [Priestia megaterium]
MDIEVGFLSKSYISDIPSWGGLFPFGIDGDAPYIIEYEGHDVDIETFINNWMKELNRFPIYTLFTYISYDAEEIDDVFSSANIEYVKLKIDRETFIKAKIENYTQFKVVMPFLYSQGSMNCFAAWSLSEDLFSFEKRDMKTLFGRRKVQMPIVTLRKDCTMFWIFYDGASVVSLSNDDLFSSTNSIINSFPKNIKGAEVEYEE